MASAHMPEELEQLNPIALQEFAARAKEGPVVMLHLLDFKGAGGAERYAEYERALAPLLERVGGRLVYSGEATAPMIGASKWDSVLLVEYPTRQAFLDMIGSPEFREIAHLRSESLERSELHPLDPATKTEE